MPITWDDFNSINKLNKKVEFEQLALFLFSHRYKIPIASVTQYANQPGVEIEPIEIEKGGKKIFASFQSKHFDNNIGWKKCEESIKVAIGKKKKGVKTYKKLEQIDVYINKDGGQTNQTRDNIEADAQKAGITVIWHYGKEILLELNDPSADEGLKNIARKFFHTSIRVPNVDPPLNMVVGRGRLIDKITQALKTQKRIQIYGFPGIGKSTIARYIAASQAMELGAAIIDARDFSGTQGGKTVESQLQLLASKAVSKFRKGEIKGNAIEIAKDLFRVDKRLLVIDNLEAPELIRAFIEAVQPERLLLTSRRQTPNCLLNGKCFLVNKLSPNAAKTQFYNSNFRSHRVFDYSLSKDTSFYKN